MRLGIPNHDFTVVIPELVGIYIVKDMTCLTIRSKFPKGRIHEGMVADFVLARKETYELGNRHPTVVVGTLEDDLMRRDFTVNALAKTELVIIDVCGGLQDLKNKVLRTPTRQFSQ